MARLEYSASPEIGLGPDAAWGSPWSVLVLDRPDLPRDKIDRAVSNCGASVHRVEGLAEGKTLARSNRCPLILIGLESENASNDVALAAIRAFRQNGFKIVAYADNLQTWFVRFRCLPLLAGASHLLDCAQPAFENELHGLIKQILLAEAGRQEEERQIRKTMAAVGVVGESQAMVSVFRAILRVSVLSDLPTLITGETGTGKERLAQAIHQLDPKRRQGPFIALNCAALSPSLAESELFGHRRGTFTGAERDRKGLIRAAHGGILFLDEIGELDGCLQVKLLRVLQENRVLAVGDEVEAAVNVRVVAATNRNLDELVHQRKFRADLFHRLNVLSVHIPPLRQRTEDILPLVEFFLAKHRLLRPDGRIAIGSDFVEALCQFELPGNVRQLENLVCQALVNKDTDTALRLSDLPVEVWQYLSGREQTSSTVTGQAVPVSQTGEQVPGETLAEGFEQWGRLLRVQGNLGRCLQWCERAVLAEAL